MMQANGTGHHRHICVRQDYDSAEEEAELAEDVREERRAAKRRRQEALVRVSLFVLVLVFAFVSMSVLVLVLVLVWAWVWVLALVWALRILLHSRRRNCLIYNPD